MRFSKGTAKTAGRRERRENPTKARLKIIQAKKFLRDLCVLCGEML